MWVGVGVGCGWGWGLGGVYVRVESVSVSHRMPPSKNMHPDNIMHDNSYVQL